MRRFTRFLLPVLLMSLAGGAAMRAQNNIYDIDDECYQLYLETEALGGKPGFREVNDKLLQTALEKNDRKAQVFYYIANLKDVIRQPFDLPTKPTEGERQAALDARTAQVLAAHEALKAKARETGYMQYFYYSYQLTKNYFYNNRMQMRALDLIAEARKIAVEEGDEYGKWTSAREMASIYQSLRDNITARKYLSLLIKEYEVSTDPTVRRQNMCTAYISYSETFPPGADSIKYYVDYAAGIRETPHDTVRCNLAYARYYAAKGDVPAYRKYRDLCMQSRLLDVVQKSAPRQLEALDALFDGRTVTRAQKDFLIDGLSILHIRLEARAAESIGNTALASELKDYCIVDNEEFFSRLNEMNLAEMEARFGNSVLSANLKEKSRQVERIMMVVFALIALILVGVMGFMYIHIRRLREARERDERRIEELKEANEKVRLADEAKTRFVQNMSHEVRTPLNAIVGFSQLLSLPDGSFQPEEKDEFSNHIVNNTKMLTMLLDDILNASAMDSGNYRISYEEGECGFMCQAAISSAEHRLQPGVTMRYVPAFEGSYQFRTDPRRVQQILINLLTNACKHTTQGEIRLGCSLEEHPGDVTFSVEDTGPGVPAEAAERIFDRFTKLNDFVQGTGLGLSICREIAGKMGGRVYLDTAYTGGARFVFVLPTEPPQDPAAPEAVSQ